MKRFFFENGRPEKKRGDLYHSGGHLWIEGISFRASLFTRQYSQDYGWPWNLLCVWRARSSHTHNCASIIANTMDNSVRTPGTSSLPSWYTPHLLCLRNARAFPLLPAALASVSFGFVLVRVRVPFPPLMRKFEVDWHFLALGYFMSPDSPLK